MKRFLIKLKNEEGFGGHQELLIVIAIVGIIGAIAIPQLVKHWDRIPWLILLACVAGICIFYAAIAGFKKIRKSSRVGIRIWSMKTGETLLKMGGRVTVKHLAFSSDGEKLFSFDNNYMFRTWEMKTGQELSSQEIQGPHDSSTALSTDLRYMAFGTTEGVIHLMEMATQKINFNWRGHKGKVEHLLFSPDNKLLASAGEDEIVQVWTLENWSKLLTFKGHITGGISQLAFSPNSQLIAYGGWADEKIGIWQIPSEENLKWIKTDSGMYSFVFSQDGKSMAIAGWGGIIGLWDVDTGREYLRLEGHAPFGKVSALTFSPDNTLLAAGSSDKTVRLWRIDEGKQLIKLRGNWENISSLIFSPDGQLLVVGSIVEV